MRIVALLLLAIAAYLLFWPIAITPQAWTPPPAPAAQGVLAPNQKLAAVETLAVQAGAGGEAVAFGPDGRLYTGFVDGRLVAIQPDTGAVEELANTGGRPLGLAFAPDGSLLIADAVHGLLALRAEGLVTLLDSVDGLKLGFADDLAVDSQGVVYLSDASHRFGHHEVTADFFEHAPNGRLIAYELGRGQARVLLDDLYFANGVALGPQEDYVLVNETSRYRVRKLWLRGPRAGEDEILVDNLPGFPDNIRRSPRDTYWVALYGPRSEQLDALLPRPFLRSVVWRLPEALQPEPPHVARVLEIDAEGKILRSLQASGEGVYAPVTCAVEHQDQLWLGSLSARGIGRYRLPGQGG